MEARDELILQYECEISLSKQRLQKSSAFMKETQLLHKLLQTVISDLTKSQKLSEKLLKQKITEVIAKIKK